MSDPRPPKARFPADLVVVGPGEGNNAEFGSLLRELRECAGLSRAEAALQIGISAEYLRLIEAGKRTPALGQMQRFLDAYGAEGGVEVPQPDGSTVDLIVFVGSHDEPTFVEFSSRIREARRSGRVDAKRHQRSEPSHEERADPRAAELGAIVSLLAAADLGLLRRIRRTLEKESS